MRYLPTGLRSNTLGNLQCSSAGNIRLGVLLPKSLFLLSLVANCEPRFFSWVKSEHRLSSLVLPDGVMFSEYRRDVPSGERPLSISSRILVCLGLPSVTRRPSVSSSLMNLMLHSEFLRDDLLDASLPRRLPMELRRLGLDTVMIGRLTVDGVGVGGLTYTSGTADFCSCDGDCTVHVGITTLWLSACAGSSTLHTLAMVVIRDSEIIILDGVHIYPI